MERAIVTVETEDKSLKKDLEIPIDISVKELCAVLNKALMFKEKNIMISGFYIKSENPINFLKGNDNLKQHNICDGTKIILC
jgi:uncharacterized ubiquitin-like protein YukD